MACSRYRLQRAVTWVAACLLVTLLQQLPGQSAQPKTPASTESEAPKDTLGRSTPKGTVLGFMTAARKGNAAIAALYLNTSLRGEDAEILARQLGLVLDRRLPAKLNEISDVPEGSLPDPLRPDEDVVGTITTANGPLDITVERVDRGKSGKVWLFSRKTLVLIPDVFQELSTRSLEEFLPRFLVTTKIAEIPLFEFVALFVGLPLLYILTGLLNRTIALSLGALRRRLTHNPSLKNPGLMPIPVRLLLMALVIRLLLPSVALPLLARQFWSTMSLLIALAACIWWLLLLNGFVESRLLRRRPGLNGSASVLRLFRRLIDGVVLFAGLLYILYHFGINITAALAGLGVGGIAIALAAQKTLENVIGGVSLIADQAVRVGDFLSLGDVQGTVEQVGLRSTRIRTLDRTLVSLPNGQIATMKLETISVRDKFWFHPLIGLRYETTPDQLKAVLDGIRTLLLQSAHIDPASVRVRFIRFGPSSFDVEMFAYASASDWSDFLCIQEQLLFRIIDVVHKSGTGIAFPSQTLYIAGDRAERDHFPFRSLHEEKEAGQAA